MKHEFMSPGREGPKPGTDKSGWMVKQGGVVKSWRRRWFVLKDTDLYYYKTQHDMKPAGEISVLGATIQNASKKSGKDFCFEVTTPARSYYLVTDTREEYDSWVAALMEATQASSSSSSNLLSQTQTTDKLVITVRGMDCDLCTTKVRNIISKQLAIEAGGIDIDANLQVVTIPKKTDHHALFNALENDGFLPCVV